jgi:hypothetical protein
MESGWKGGRVVGKEGEWLVTEVSSLKSSKEIGDEGRSMVLTIDEWLGCGENALKVLTTILGKHLKH